MTIIHQDSRLTSENVRIIIMANSTAEQMTKYQSDEAQTDDQGRPLSSIVG